MIKLPEPFVTAELRVVDESDVGKPYLQQDGKVGTVAGKRVGRYLNLLQPERPPDDFGVQEYRVWKEGDWLALHLHDGWKKHRTSRANHLGVCKWVIKEPEGKWQEGHGVFYHPDFQSLSKSDIVRMLNDRPCPISIDETKRICRLLDGTLLAKIVSIIELAAGREEAIEKVRECVL